VKEYEEERGFETYDFEKAKEASEKSSYSDKIFATDVEPSRGRKSGTNTPAPRKSAGASRTPAGNRGAKKAADEEEQEEKAAPVTDAPMDIDRPEAPASKSESVEQGENKSMSSDRMQLDSDQSTVSKPKGKSKDHKVPDVDGDEVPTEAPTPVGPQEPQTSEEANTITTVAPRKVSKSTQESAPKTEPKPSAATDSKKSAAKPAAASKRSIKERESLITKFVNDALKRDVNNYRRELPMDEPSWEESIKNVITVRNIAQDKSEPLLIFYVLWWVFPVFFFFFRAHRIR
jgi:hypothetical protein